MLEKVKLVVLVAVIVGLVILGRNLEEYVTSENITVNEDTIVIDAGHGGSDPGKVGCNDALEKDINLQIAQKLKVLLEEKGLKVVMTREEDKSLATDESSSQKVQDMKARVELIDKSSPKLAVSIHQNSYQDSSIHGAQVFYYSHSSEGEQNAVLMQEALLAVDEDNTRQAKANDTYYLLKRTQTPTIIVECGFLSNPEEAEKLIDEDYQEQLAEAIAAGIESCLAN